jgi:hypothetical protein
MERYAQPGAALRMIESILRHLPGCERWALDRTHRSRVLALHPARRARTVRCQTEQQ